MNELWGGMLMMVRNLTQAALKGTLLVPSAPLPPSSLCLIPRLYSDSSDLSNDWLYFWLALATPSALPMVSF